VDLSDIDVVLDRLDAVVAGDRRDEHRSGYFAAMYRSVTRAVRAAVVGNRFSDGRRLAQLDRVFAERYLDAHERWRTGQRNTAAWGAAFTAAEAWPPLIIQHLLMGMNAHINLDLGIAAATVAPGGDLPGIRGDFDVINLVLAELMEAVMADIHAVSPWIERLDTFGGRNDQAVIRFSIERARREAWRLAEQLAAAPADRWPRIIDARDRWTADFAGLLLRPGSVLPLGLLVIRLRESNDVPRVIDLLGD
jgi:Family of unknown function (DUF5995)